jgi:hypothetical protein
MLAACFLIAICLQCQTQPASKLALPFTVRKASAASLLLLLLAPTIDSLSLALMSLCISLKNIPEKILKLKF